MNKRKATKSDLKKSDLKVGLKFKIFFNENNYNNIDYCEVKSIIDNCQIVLFCKNPGNKNGLDDKYYKLIDILDFETYIKHKVVLFKL